jgi:hypothetical protein
MNHLSLDDYVFNAQTDPLLIILWNGIYAKAEYAADEVINKRRSILKQTSQQ